MTIRARAFGCGLGATVVLAGLCPAPPARSACKIDMIANLPVTMEGLRPKVRAKINGAEATFLADSGAFYSVITPASAKEFGLNPQPAPVGFYMIGLGGNASVSIARVKALTFAGYTLPNVDFLVGGSEVGDDGGGLIGQNFLGFVDAEYDLAGGAIRLMRPKGCGDADLAYWSANGAHSVMDIEPTQGPLNRKIVGAVFVNGVRLRAELDTGAPNSILWRRPAKRAGIDVGAAGATDAGLSSGIGRGHYHVWVAPVDSFKIGGEEIRHTRLVIGDTDINVADAPDMLLGADFFLAHRLYVANSQHKLYFTYNGGPVFDIKVGGGASPPAASAQPTPAADGSIKSALIDATPVDADGFARRGSALAARAAFGPAVADLTRAVEMAPREARYRVLRARAYLGSQRPAAALADLDTALTLDPGNADALISRAMMREPLKDPAGMLADLNAAGKVLPPEADARFVLARLYETADASSEAVAQYDLWIKAHPEDNKRPIALSGRCRARAMLGEALDQAMADCNAAVRAMPRIADPLQSRGLVDLRRGDLDRAMADDQAALALDPKSAWALYGRGLVELKKGMAAQGQTDIAAATALAPGLPARLKARGIAP